jgi:nucleoside-diphosphate-sugar epimerase
MSSAIFVSVISPFCFVETFLDIESAPLKCDPTEVTSLKKLNFRPQVKIEQGIQSFVDWYKDYYGL